MQCVADDRVRLATRRNPEFRHNFQFSGRDDGVATHLMRSAGQHVVLSYEQHRGVRVNCFGETEYYITANAARAWEPVENPLPL